MNSYPLDNSLIKMTTSFSKGCFNFQVASNHALDKVRLNYSGNRFELNGNPRGLGFSIGCPNGYFTSKIICLGNIRVFGDARLRKPPKDGNPKKCAAA